MQVAPSGFGATFALTMLQSSSLSTAVERSRCCAAHKHEQISLMLVLAELAELSSRNEGSLSFNKLGHLELASAHAALGLAYNIPLATAAFNGVVGIADGDGASLSSDWCL